MIDILEQIEYEEEGSSLDFKAIEYKSATNAELVKDVLAFANSYMRCLVCDTIRAHLSRG